MNYWVYVLRSQATGKFYIGQTSNLRKRLAEHNGSRTKYTSSGVPWSLVYYEPHPSRTEAIKRERFLKSPQGWKSLQQIKQNLSQIDIQGVAGSP